MSHLTNDNFHEVVSEPDWGITCCIRAVMFFLLGFLVLGFYFVPLLFYTDGTIDQEQLLVFGMFYYPLLIVLSYFVVRFLKRRKRKSVRHIKVNCEGIFYELLDGTEESLRFDQLEVSSEDYIVLTSPQQTGAFKSRGFADELLILKRGNIHEKIKVYRSTDRLCHQAGRDRYARRGSVPQNGNQ